MAADFNSSDQIVNAMLASMNIDPNSEAASNKDYVNGQLAKAALSYKIKGQEEEKSEGESSDGNTPQMSADDISDIVSSFME